ncbi:hypothetical protein E2C01_101055 [Portunus trituberculatus]|uniref:Uncharacterized protein n=1 Tax=Portunus trituberculatus TaxID=210409 RepID=A0A5B7KJH9_PORTR|nr:hypothetical protein [Portunus trituberculatus]
MQENVILMTMAAQVTTGGGGRGTPGSLCLQPHVWMFDYQDSLDTWPNVNVMVGHTMTDDLCTACSKNKPVKLLQMYGQLYNQQTLCSREALPSESDIKVSHPTQVVPPSILLENSLVDGLIHNASWIFRPHCDSLSFTFAYSN